MNLIQRTCCPACSSFESHCLYKSKYTENPIHDFVASHYKSQGLIDWSLLGNELYSILECKKCKLIYQEYVPDFAFMGQLYNSFIETDRLKKLEDERLTLGNFQDISSELSLLFRLVDKKPSEISFLDFGFGHGRWARVARAMGANVYVTEYGDDKVQSSRAIGVELIDDDDVARMKFDIVHTEQVFEHLMHPGAEFKRLADSTRHLMKVAVPRHKNIHSVLKDRTIPSQSPFERTPNTNDWTWSDRTCVSILPLEHINTFTTKSIEFLAAANGMTIVGRKRRRDAYLEMSSVSSLARSAAKFARLLAKTVAPETGGYFVFKKA